MSKLRASITFQHRIDEIKKIQQEKIREHIAGPINEQTTPIVIDDNQENDTNINIQEDILEDNELDNSQVSNWNSLIETWEQLLLQEEAAELDNENDVDYDFDVEINDNLLNQTHPAIDSEAKWNITNIFINNLDTPFKDISD
jgi:hypothetical protein